MASLKDLRDRIASVKATQKITRAMQMIAATRLRRAQAAAEAARPYSQRMAAMLANIVNNVELADAPKLLTGDGRAEVHLVVICTAERGLCGGFNMQIIRAAREFVRDLLHNGKTVKIITVGKKGLDGLKGSFGKKMIDHVDLREVKQISYANAEVIAEKVRMLFERGEFDVCTLFYSKFHSVISQVPTAAQLVPAPQLVFDAAGETQNQAVEKQTAAALYEYEPDAVTILNEIASQNISVQIFQALLENAAGEMGAKMTAMDNATRNAGEMIDKLSISYNRQRQAQITTELIEIIAGAEAL